MSKKPPAPPASPFARLAGLREQLPSAPAPTATPAAPTTPPAPRGPARAVVRYERKGRRGKEVTLVEKLALGDAELDAWCRDLKRALGCGGSVEAGAILLAGDQRTRLAPLLEARGVRKITIS
ncbi:MAG TPA: translation initiation factor [Kofleriaceae bacterium]|nr:translation initiation factor [Kofleriaceae bacterium]